MINLHNLYAEHCATKKKNREEHLAILADAFGRRVEELPRDFGEAKPRLRPKVWQRATIAFQQLQSKARNEEGFDLPLTPIGSHLVATIVFDNEHSMRTVSRGELEKWGVSISEAMDVAIRNLDEDTVAFAKMGDHLASSMTGDSYDSSRILLGNKLKSLELGDELIAMLPSRDSLLVAGSLDSQTLELLFELSQPLESEETYEQPLSPLPVCFQEKRWEDWEPPRNHALRERFDDLSRDYLGPLYNEQKDLLDAFENEEDAAFVASFSGIRHEDDGKVLSYCVWSVGVDTLLPRTDLVVLNADHGDDPLQVEWDEVMRVAGDLVDVDESYYPTRYRVREFPSQTQLSEMKPFC